jgi:hypothetical protein
MFHVPSPLRTARLLGLLLSLLLTCTALLAFGVPAYAHSAVPCCNGGFTYDRTNAVSYANNHWNWTYYDPNNHGTVSEGSPQRNFQCAEFVARALTHGGIVPGLSAYWSNQNAYEYYQPGNGRTYDLLAITPGISPTGYDLHDYLVDSGVSVGIGQDLGRAQAGDVVIFTDNNIARHTALIVHVGTNTSTTLVDAHNNAANNTPLSDEISGFDGWFIVHITV